jgi:hypothetical protein
MCPEKKTDGPSYMPSSVTEVAICPMPRRTISGGGAHPSCTISLGCPCLCLCGTSGSGYGPVVTAGSDAQARLSRRHRTPHMFGTISWAALVPCRHLALGHDIRFQVWLSRRRSTGRGTGASAVIPAPHSAKRLAGSATATGRRLRRVPPRRDE